MPELPRRATVGGADAVEEATLHLLGREGRERALLGRVERLLPVEGGPAREPEELRLVGEGPGAPELGRAEDDLRGLDRVPALDTGRGEVDLIPNEDTDLARAPLGRERDRLLRPLRGAVHVRGAPRPEPVDRAHLGREREDARVVGGVLEARGEHLASVLVVRDHEERDARVGEPVRGRRGELDGLRELVERRGERLGRDRRALRGGEEREPLLPVRARLLALGDARVGLMTRASADEDERQEADPSHPERSYHVPSPGPASPGTNALGRANLLP